jgi:hypothetical protein
MIVLKNENTGARLCYDGKFRNFANFGTFPDCVKVFKSKGWALRKQEELMRFHNCPCEIVFLNGNRTMDASGMIHKMD